MSRDFRVFPYEGWLWVTNLSNLTAIKRYWAVPVDTLKDDPSNGSTIPGDRSFDEEVIEVLKTCRLIKEVSLPDESDSLWLWDEVWDEVCGKFAHYLSLFGIATRRASSTRYPTIHDARSEECQEGSKERWLQMKEGKPIIMTEDRKKKIITEALKMEG